LRIREVEEEEVVKGTPQEEKEREAHHDGKTGTSSLRAAGAGFWPILDYNRGGVWEDTKQWREEDNQNKIIHQGRPDPTDGCEGKQVGLNISLPNRTKVKHAHGYGGHRKITGKCGSRDHSDGLWQKTNYR